MAKRNDDTVFKLTFEKRMNLGDAEMLVADASRRAALKEIPVSGGELVRIDVLPRQTAIYLKGDKRFAEELRDLLATGSGKTKALVATVRAAELLKSI